MQHNRLAAAKMAKPEKNSTFVEQSDFVRFNASWNDDLNLSAYIFSTNSSGIWINLSGVEFSGSANRVKHDFSGEFISQI